INVLGCLQKYQGLFSSSHGHRGLKRCSKTQSVAAPKENLVAPTQISTLPKKARDMLSYHMATA
ncbi:hypothetical protein, partial [Aeromonas veronii]|uniref:hypothetical protein n=1 Tax=Aeromonas veronii TaxID=654 RepID=UPI003F678AE9